MRPYPRAETALQEDARWKGKPAQALTLMAGTPWRMGVTTTSTSTGATMSFDKQTIDIPCPRCGHKLTEQIGRLQPHMSFVCAGCKEPVEINATELLRKVKQANQQLADFGKRVSRIGKRR